LFPGEAPNFLGSLGAAFTVVDGHRPEEVSMPLELSSFPRSRSARRLIETVPFLAADGGVALSRRRP